MSQGYQTPEERAASIFERAIMRDGITSDDDFRRTVAAEINAAEEYLRDQMRGLDAIVVSTRAERDAAVKRAEEAEHRAAFPDRPRCAYCDWEGNEETTWEILRAHIESCPTHPIAQLTDRATRAEQERDEARARVGEVEGALRPFAKAADYSDTWGRSMFTDRAGLATVIIDRMGTPEFTLGDLRRARALLTPAASTRGEERCEAECPACHFGVPQDGHRLCDGCEAVEARRDICTTACDHGSPCLLRAGHGGGHETQHGCVCYDPRPTPARDGESSNA